MSSLIFELQASAVKLRTVGCFVQKVKQHLRAHFINDNISFKLNLYSTTNHANVSEQAADSAEDDWIMMNNRLPAVTLRLLANCILRKRIQMYGKTCLQHT